MSFYHDPSSPPLFSAPYKAINVRHFESYSAAQASLRDTEKYLQPLPHVMLRDVAAISTCIHQNAAIDQAGGLWVWGASYMAQADDGYYSNDLPQQIERVPQKIMDNVMSVSQGAWHTLCITHDHKLWGWGSNGSGELGITDQIKQAAPICLMDNCIYAFANDAQSFAIRTDGSLWGWGNNENGVLLDAGKECSSPVFLLDSVASICVGAEHAYAIKEDGTLWGWGMNIDGAIFTMPRYRWCKPTLLMEGVKSTSIPASDVDGYHFVLMENGDLYSIGAAESGSMVPSRQRRDAGAMPIKVMSGVAEAKAGHHFSLIRLLDGQLLAVGENSLGQCGTGKSTGRIRVPTQIGVDFQAAATGYHHALGLLKNGNLLIWGGDYGIRNKSQDKGTVSTC